MNEVKIVIGANYGDEGKGLMSRHFVLDAQNRGKKPVVILHNGTAQRGHTVDYNPGMRHVYHHFGAGAADGAATFFAKTFYVHPMEFHREWEELHKDFDIYPTVICDPEAYVITPFDMLVDRLTEDYIEQKNGKREFGSCCFGSWCAIEERIPHTYTDYNVMDYLSAMANTDTSLIKIMLEKTWHCCLAILTNRGVDISTTTYKNLLTDRTAIIENFIEDLTFFFGHIALLTFKSLFNDTVFDSFIFEGAQGLLLDKNNGNNWHTTSNTGLTNPYNMLKDMGSFDAEVCYVSRSYLTRHGEGKMEGKSFDISEKGMNIDLTNVPNPYQGTLRYSTINRAAFFGRIELDYLAAYYDRRFTQTIAITHKNEIDCDILSNYDSFSPYEVVRVDK